MNAKVMFYWPRLKMVRVIRFDKIWFFFQDDEDFEDSRNGFDNSSESPIKPVVSWLCIPNFSITS